ncbi:MAG: M1 family metallopeptidase [Clostridia bacterium]|nr:M1 family metallopeptidase [Clostridia bacterium]
MGCKSKDEIDKISRNLTCYDIIVDLDAETKSATVTTNIDYINNTNSVLKEVKLRLYPQFFEKGATTTIVGMTNMNNAYPNGLSYGDFEVTKVTSNGQDFDVTYEGDFCGILRVPFSNSLMPDNHAKISIVSKLTLPNCLHRFGYGENTINLANFYPIICVFEDGEFVIDPYNSNGDPFYSEIANYNVEILTDSTFVVAGTGEKSVETKTDGRTLTKFCAKAVRDFACVLSNKFQIISKKWQDIEVEYYYFDDQNAEKSLQAGIDAISTFSSMFGRYPYDKFSVVQTDFIYGGMEYPMLVMISADVDNLDDFLNVIIHETAHQWWYGIVGNNEYKYPWLDEALTEYSTVLFYDENDGYNMSHKEMVEAYRENYSLFVTVYNDVLGKLDTSMRAVDEYDTEPEYTYCTYVKGVLMFDSLYQLVGKENFVSSLKQYFEENKFKNAVPENLISCFSDICKTDLNSFFESWKEGKVVIR